MLQITRTDDGSDTLRDTTLDVTYHSMHGAVTESRHVFIDAGLEPLLERRSQLSILEVGFGTGLNALLTAVRVANSDHQVVYHAIDHEPPPWKLIRQLNYPEYLNTPHASDLLHAMHHAPPDGVTMAGMRFHLHQNDVKQITLPEHINLVYFDAFDPGVHPSMWDTDILQCLFACMVSGGVLVTYCARGQFKRDLRACGFAVETLPGSPGKREMVRARR